MTVQSGSYLSAASVLCSLGADCPSAAPVHLPVGLEVGLAHLAVSGGRLHNPLQHVSAQQVSGTGQRLHLYILFLDSFPGQL